MSVLKSMFRATVLALCSAALSGCLTLGTRSAAPERAVQSVAVVSLLNERTQIHGGGLTVFSKRAWTVDQTGVLNRIATEHLEARLRIARPDWQFKNAQAHLSGLKAAQDAAGLSWSSPVSAISKELAATASTLDVDRMFVIVDSTNERLAGRGVAVTLLQEGKASLENVRVQASVVVVLVDRNGNHIATNNSGTEDWAPRLAGPLGLDYGMTRIDDPQVQTQLKATMHEQLRAMLTLAAIRLGY